MKKFTKILALMLTLCCMLFVVSGCQNKKDNNSADNQKQEEKEGKLSVVTTIFPYYDFVRQVAGDKVELNMAVPAGMDTHSFEPTAADMVKIGKADIIIYNGGSMEQWVSEVLKATANDKLQAECMMDSVDTVDEEIVEGMEDEEHEHGEENDDSEEAHDSHKDDAVTSEDAAASENTDADNSEDSKDGENEGHSDSEEHEQDEHIWTSPVNAQKIVKRIAEILADADKENADYYFDNAEQYIGKLDELDTEFKDITENAKRNYLVFADRFPLRYFVDEYGLTYSAAFSGCSSDTEPSADTVAYLIDKVKTEQVPVILKIELTSSKVADTIAKETGTKVETFSTCHNVTKEQFDSGVTYYDLMKENMSVLRDALD